MASKDVMGHCCFIECKRDPLLITDGRTDVRAYCVDKCEQKGFKVKWDENGMAMFHIDCWNSLWRSACAKSPSSIIVVLPEMEKDMIREAAKTAETHHSLKKIKEEGERIAQLIKKSNYCIAFTGAGISTAAGIGDFRGIHGKWTTQDKVKQYGQRGLSKKGGYRLADLRPTYTHEALLKLVELGYIKYVISQNTDGLHRLSGIQESMISELHGNAFLEKCEKCGKRYEKNTRCKAQSTSVPPKVCERCHINHRTGGVCMNQKCGGYLMNTIINFGDYLEEDVLGNAVHHAERADLVITLGSTLQVSPANSLVEMGEKPTRLVICNRQGTPYDAVCCDMEEDGRSMLGSRVFGDCDKLMSDIMRHMLSKEELQDWEGRREERLVTYDLKRKL
ncbi:NAD-dependent protein deacetylase Sirt6-like [Ostrea edulis]|uniref:NAD-dependent protein deacetylase Sirt6-like n=1 Tax=Ostrea edulis TaxID=37623 RepID=UPI002094CCC4|nr:NAD-dependent protein deacetylase Sirt6-like [Ostrea edulis]